MRMFLQNFFSWELSRCLARVIILALCTLHLLVGYNFYHLTILSHFCRSCTNGRLHVICYYFVLLFCMPYHLWMVNSSSLLSWCVSETLALLILKISVFYSNTHSVRWGLSTLSILVRCKGFLANFSFILYSGIRLDTFLMQVKTLIPATTVEFTMSCWYWNLQAYYLFFIFLKNLMHFCFHFLLLF